MKSSVQTVAAAATRAPAKATARWRGLAAGVAVLALCGAVPPPATATPVRRVADRREHILLVRSASLEATNAPDGHPLGAYEADVEFTEPHLEALRDDETTAELSVVDRDGHGGRRLLEDLEDCRLPADGSMSCPGGVVFQRVAGPSSRWRIVIAFRRRSPAAAFHGPVTVRFSYSVSGGPETVQSGTIASCAPARGGPTLTCRAKRKPRRRPPSRPRA